MNVNEIFHSIEGEGIRAGMPCVFVRFNGCNLNCSYCDTKYAQSFEAEGTMMTPAEIASKVLEFGCPLVTLTGGEPLIQKGIEELVQKLLDLGLHVNIETNGSVDPTKLLAHLSTPRCSSDLIITMDYKSISSGCNSSMNLSNFLALKCYDVVKFVVGSREDLEDAARVIAAIRIAKGMFDSPLVFFSPVFGAIEPSEIVEFLKERRLEDCRMQLQLHKFIWDPEKRGV